MSILNAEEMPCDKHYKPTSNKPKSLVDKILLTASKLWLVTAQDGQRTLMYTKSD